jgi:hypothetical protein
MTIVESRSHGVGQEVQYSLHQIVTGTVITALLALKNKGKPA